MGYTVNFTTYQGNTFSKDFYIKDSEDEKMNLSAFGFRGIIKTRTDNTIVGSFEFSAIDNFFINMRISAQNSALMLAGVHKFDVERFTENDDFVDKIMIGEIEILEEITI